MLRLCLLQYPFLIFSFLLPLVSDHSLAIAEETAFSLSEKLALETHAKPAGPATTGEESSLFIRLSTAHFDPLEIPASTAQPNTLATSTIKQTDYYIVQFIGSVEKSWKASLEEMGVEILDYVPDFAFIIRMDSEAVSQVSSLAYVRWLGMYKPTYRISRELSAHATQLKTTSKDTKPDESKASTIALHVTAFPGESVNNLRSAIASRGGIVTDTVQTSWKTSFNLQISPDRISDIAAIPGIKWVESMPEWKLFNNESTDIMNIRAPRESHGLFGAGQTIGICDTGLDRGTIDPDNLHDDFEDGAGGSRVAAIFDMVGDGADDLNGHGTHVAGSVLGNGLLSGCIPADNFFPSTCFAGTAPQAELVFQAIEENGSGRLDGLPTDLNVLFRQAQEAGAELHSNSWGHAIGGIYSSAAEDVDQYMWDHPEFLILFAAGNSGVDKNGDGVVDLYSVASPATAKNCITVGATEGNRPSGTGVDGRWGADLWSQYYSASPIFEDHYSDNPRGMAAYSSRGPTLDGRYKPDLVAPGTNILSTRSLLPGAGTGDVVYDDQYVWMGGTSMATPLTAGAAALMREYLIGVEGFTDPTAALVKAALFSGAEDISPGQYGTGAAREIPHSPVPNNVSGWGRVNIGNSVYSDKPFSRFYIDEHNALNTGESNHYTIDVSSSDTPLKINLVWTDYPGSPANQGALVNDLDLQVIDPASGTHFPDGASQRSAVNHLVYDSGNLYRYTQKTRAVRFTPSIYPAHIDSTTFFFYNPNFLTEDVAIVVYDDDADGLPGTELFRKTLAFVPTGWSTVGLTGVTVTSGDFYIALEKQYDPDMGVVWEGDNPHSRNYYYDETTSAWMLASNSALLRANVRGIAYSTTFDRVNNTLGLTLNNPSKGKYRIDVKGYNIPFGPQPYAMVISCEQCTLQGDDDFPWSMFVPAISSGK